MIPGNNPPASRLAAGDISIDREMFSVYVGHTEIHVTPSEYRIIEYLLMYNGRVVSKASLTAFLHKGKTNRTSNVVEVLISQINKKLAASGSRSVIKSKRAFGYYLKTVKSGVRA